MGINCKIHYNKDNTIDFVEDKNGKRSELFDSLRSIFNEYKALNLYALTESDFFKNKKEISVKDLVVYSNSTDETLSKKETVDAKNTAISFNVNSSQELITKLEEAFLDKNGVFILDKEKMLKAGYDSYEVTNILSTPKLADKIENTLYKLRNTFFELDEYPSNIKRISGVNSFGKRNIENPYITEKNSLPQQQIKTIVNGELVNKTKGDSVNILKKTYPIEAPPISTELNILLNSITNVTNNVGNTEYKDVQSVVKGIKKGVVEYGVDLRDIENRVLPIKKLKTFLAELRNYIKNPTDNFAQIYDDFFELTEEVTEPTTQDNTIKIITDLSEYELYRDFGLIRINKDNYRQVDNTSPIDVLYRQFFAQQNEIQTIEEVKSKISELEVEDFNTNSEILEAMYMWKKFLNLQIKTQPNYSIDYIDIKESINNPYKQITSKGIRLINEDPITKGNSELYEKKTIKEEKIETDINKVKRIQALENPSKIEKIKTNYSYIEQGVLMTHNNSETFVRTPQGVFEKIYEQGDLNFYSPVISEIKNLSDLDFSKYFLEEIKVDDMIKIEPKHSKKELEEINNKYFKCQ